MRFRCRTDRGPHALARGFPVAAPFRAHKDIETLSTLLSTWEAGLPAFPVDPRLPLLPGMPVGTNSYATLLYTSGSSGAPKIACHSFDNYLHSARGSLAALQLDTNDRWLLSLPLFHVGGLAILFRCQEAGAEVVLSELPLLDALLTHQITHLSLVPTQLYRLLREPPSKLACAARALKTLLLGGAPAPSTLVERAKEAGLPVHTTYGLTEMTSQVTMDPFPGALPYRQVKIAADGEIFVRGETLFQGYLDTSLDSPLDTCLALDEEGWLATRDLGRWNSDGCLEVLGRKDNLFISGGENIQPEEIEQLLLALPDLLEAFVVPQPDPEFGMRPAAFIATASRAYSLEEIRERLSAKLPPYKLPVALYALPEEASGIKRSRQKLAQQLSQQGKHPLT